MSNSSVTNALKIYFFPSLVTIVAMLIWRDVSELRSDVKSLLAQSNVDKTRIDALQKQLDILNQTILKSAPAVPVNSALYNYSSKEFVLTSQQKKKKYVRYT